MVDRESWLESISKRIINVFKKKESVVYYGPGGERIMGTKEIARIMQSPPSENTKLPPPTRFAQTIGALYRENDPNSSEQS